MSRVGIGIITCNRPEFFKKCRESIKAEWYDSIVVVNDGKGPLFDARAPILSTAGGEGVGRAKNKAIRHLLEEDCDYIILVEDDMLFKGNIFEQYIKAHKATGIHHFMFAYHGPANKANISGGNPAGKCISCIKLKFWAIFKYILSLGSSSSTPNTRLILLISLAVVTTLQIKVNTLLIRSLLGQNRSIFIFNFFKVINHFLHRCIINLDR